MLLYVIIFLVNCLLTRVVVLGDVEILQRDQYISVGQDRFLNCEVNDEDEVEKIVWKKDGVNLQEDERVSKEDDELMIAHISAEDAGSYHCEAFMSDGSVIPSQPVILTLYESISFIACKPSLVVQKGNDTRVDCSASGEPAPRLSWSHAGKTVKKKGERVGVEGGVLLMRKPGLDDSGVYSLVARQSRLGIRETFHVNITVYEPVKMGTGMVDRVDVVEGEDVSVTCTASGHPSPSFHFTNASTNEKIKASDGVSITTTDTQATLTFKATQPHSMGDVLCEASNDFSLDSHSIFINVLQPPRVTRFENVTGTDGGVLEMTCHAFANPLPFIEIGVLGGVSKQRSEFPASNFTFTIATATRDSEGIYYCLATHNNYTAFPDNQTENYVTILYTPVIENSLSSRQAATWLGHPVQLSCIVNSNPPPTIHWLDGDQVVVSFDGDSPDEESSSSLSSSSANFSGQTSIHPHHYYHSHIKVVPRVKEEIERKLTCKASNQLGSSLQFFQVLEAFIPGLPVIQGLEDLTATSVIVVVGEVDDGGTPITHYRGVYYQEDKREETERTAVRIAVTNETQMKLMIEGLQQKTSYLIEVSAENGVGGGLSAVTNVTTKDREIPSKVPILLQQLACHDGNKVEVSWIEPYSSGLPINLYKVQYGQVNTDKRLQNVTTWLPMETKETSLKLHSLQPSSEYHVYVQAHNDVGWSKEMDVHSFHVCKDEPLNLIFVGNDRYPIQEASRSGGASINHRSGIIIITTLLTIIMAL